VFQFKRFIIHQDQCGMKVAIDSCIFGASVDVKSSEQILDIGTGTGLLSLMLAQKAEVKIDAIELDEAAYLQAKSNIEISPFYPNIKIHHTDIKDFNKKNYDLIIVNPPFFENDFISPITKKYKAKHQSDLTLLELAKIINQKLIQSGRAAILLPAKGMGKFEKYMADLGLQKTKSLLIRHRPGNGIIREVAEFKRSSSTKEIVEICIKEVDNVTYTKDFQQLMKDYYIIF
jgi:tRNA1Val (adenine37-N6)-methyltransferase